jgi:hypothetical protein
MTSVRWPLIKATLKGIGCSREVVLTFIHRATSPVARLQIAVWGSLKTYWRCSFGLPTNCNQLNHQARISPVMLLRCRAQEGAKNSLSLREPPHWPRHEAPGPDRICRGPTTPTPHSDFLRATGPNPEDAAIARANLRGAPKFMCPIGSGRARLLHEAGRRGTTSCDGPNACAAFGLRSPRFSGVSLPRIRLGAARTDLPESKVAGLESLT